MALFKGDMFWMRVALVTPLGAAVLGFLTGYFFSNVVVFAMTAALAVLFVLAWIDSAGKEIAALVNWGAMLNVFVMLLTLWITTVSVNGWWAKLIPSGLLR